MGRFTMPDSKLIEYMNRIRDRGKTCEDMNCNITTIEIRDLRYLKYIYCSEANIEYNEDEIEIEEMRMLYCRMMESGSFIRGLTVKVDNDEYLVAVVSINKVLNCNILYKDSDYINLASLVVLKECQNLGIGTKLMVNIVKELKEDGCACVEIQSNNFRVKRIAKKCGLTQSYIDMRMKGVEQGK